MKQVGGEMTTTLTNDGARNVVVFTLPTQSCIKYEINFHMLVLFIYSSEMWSQDGHNFVCSSDVQCCESLWIVNMTRFDWMWYTVILHVVRI